MEQLRWAARHKPRALTMLLLTGLLLTAASMIFAANSVNHIRGDFCTWVTVHYRADQQPPHTQRAREYEQADKQLGQRLGCR